MTETPTQYEAGTVLKNVRCCECNKMIKTAIARKSGFIICEACYEPTGPICGLSRVYFNDDMSGNGSSWDSIVRALEGN